MSTPEQEKKAAALNSVLAAVGLTVMKVVVGVISGSLGVLAEAAHSGLDLVAAVCTYFAVRISSKPADKEHLYGHGKVESLSALFEAGLLLATCIWVIREAVHRFMAGENHVDASIWAFAVVVVSMAVDISRSRMLLRMAKKHKSQALEADALHFSTDIWSSAVVLVGLAGVKLAAWFPTLKFLQWADCVAALAVAMIVIWVCARMGWQTIHDLIDSAPKDLPEKVKSIAESVEEVKGCHAVRVRRSGPEIFIDAHIELEGDLPLVQAHRVTDLVENAIRAEIAGADITVHAEPLVRTPDGKEPSN